MLKVQYSNGGRMRVILKDEPLEEVDCFFLSTWSCKWQLMEDVMEDVKGMWYTE